MTTEEALEHVLDVATDNCHFSEPRGTNELRKALQALADVRTLDEYSERHGQQWRVFANVAGPYGTLPYYCEVGGKTFGGDGYGAARASAAAAIRALPEKGTL